MDDMAEMGEKKGLGNEIEGVILQVLSHKKRRNILRVVDSSPGGASYSTILGETGLSTGRLNYHLKELAGFVLRDEDRKYQLTDLGRKALSVLNYTREDLKDEYEGFLSAARANRRKFIKKNLNRAFYFLAALILAGPIVATYLLWREPAAHWILLVVWSICLVLIYAMDRVRRKSPRHVMGFIDWLDWKLFDERHSGRFEGSKLLVGLLVGVLIGAAIGKVGLGILIGLFIGAAMNA